MTAGTATSIPARTASTVANGDITTYSGMASPTTISSTTTWHLSFEHSMTSIMNGVPNLQGSNPGRPGAQRDAFGFPTAARLVLSPPFISHNAPNEAHCSARQRRSIRCNAYARSARSPTSTTPPEPMDNFSFRPEIYPTTRKDSAPATAATYYEGLDRLAALVLATNRGAAGSWLLPLERRERLQRRLKELDGDRRRRPDLPLLTAKRSVERRVVDARRSSRAAKHSAAIDIPPPNEAKHDDDKILFKFSGEAAY